MAHPTHHRIRPATSRMVRMMILVTASTKRRLLAMRQHGTTQSGYIRSLIVRDLNANK